MPRLAEPSSVTKRPFPPVPSQSLYRGCGINQVPWSSYCTIWSYVARCLLTYRPYQISNTSWLSIKDTASYHTILLSGCTWTISSLYHGYKVQYQQCSWLFVFCQFLWLFVMWCWPAIDDDGCLVLSRIIRQIDNEFQWMRKIIPWNKI